jgi:O-antigen ligase
MLNVTLFAFPSRLMPLAIIATAVVLGVAFTFTGISGIFVAAALCLPVVFGLVAANFAASTLGAAICCLGLMPFEWGLQTGVLPKLVADEVLLVLYLAVFPALYLFTGRVWRHGFRTLYIVLGLFLLAHALSFVYPSDLVSFRNFIETYVLGAMLLVLVLQEAANANSETIARFVVWTTVLIAALSIVERIFQRNPVMGTNELYASAELVRITGGVYRPYVTFFLPSEAGTFMALGAPFAVREWLVKRSWTSALLLVLIAAALWVNATRGVWVAVVLAAVFASKRPLRYVMTSVPVALLAGWVMSIVFGSTPFFKRITDPSDLLYRLEYWKIGARIFAGHPLVGVGHSQFKKVYLQYVTDLSNVITFDISTIFVADNMFLTTTIEHGLLGLIALLAFLIYVGFRLRTTRIELTRQGQDAKASLVRCVEIALVIYTATGFLADVNQFSKVTKYMFILLGLGLAQGVGLAASGRVQIIEAITQPALQAQHA